MKLKVTQHVNIRPGLLTPCPVWVSQLMKMSSEIIKNPF